jgi:CBS domain-containing membrane protein
MHDLRVRDLMTHAVIAVRPEENLARAYELMLDHRIRHLLVVDGEGDLVGLLTHRDLLRHSLIEQVAVSPAMARKVLRRIRIEEAMTSEVETADPEQLLGEAALVMFDNKFGCLPVVEGARPVGILTEADFVRFFALRPLRPAIATAAWVA